ncbi:type II toxin-antitoxin system RelE/ParE family toxin [Candidatus Uhrbacteria bacterium]|nr:type II toxin-antitoxin system RelE/ParE family toxin [Candidatus Uhrbacteria bacterium]
MKVIFAHPFLSQFKKLSAQTKKKFEKQLTYLLRTLQYPSLHAKKYDEARDIWQARVDKSYRFYFQIKDDTYTILHITKHPK